MGKQHQSNKYQAPFCPYHQAYPCPSWEWRKPWALTLAGFQTSLTAEKLFISDQVFFRGIIAVQVALQKANKDPVELLRLSEILSVHAHLFLVGKVIFQIQERTSLASTSKLDPPRYHTKTKK